MCRSSYSLLTRLDSLRICILVVVILVIIWLIVDRGRVVRIRFWGLFFCRVLIEISICIFMSVLESLEKNGCTFLGSSKCMAVWTAVRAIDLGNNHRNIACYKI